MNTYLITTPLALALSGMKLYGAIAAGVLVLLILIVLLLGKKRLTPEVRRLVSISFPAPWRTILKERFPIYGKLPPRTRENLHRHIQVFIGTKEFLGSDDLEITDEIRLLIAAQASLLICNIDEEYTCYDNLARIVIHPRQFLKEEGGALTDGVAIPPFLDASGMIPGEIHLSWSEVQTGIADGQDGYNPVFHYFAKALDQSDLEEDGVPSHHIGDKTAWLRVWQSYFLKFQAQVRSGSQTALDPSAAASLPEFFAVATEVFFEAPDRLRRELPGLFQKLHHFYRQDPTRY